jgi:hypothetical protein
MFFIVQTYHFVFELVPTNVNFNSLEGLCVDLTIDGEVIDSGKYTVDSYFFWQDMGHCAERAMYRIKTKNPKQSFDLSMAAFAMSMLTEKEKAERFIDHVKDKAPGIDVERCWPSSPHS